MRKDLDKLTEFALRRGISGAIEDVYSLHEWLDLPFTLAEQERQFKTVYSFNSTLPDLQSWIENLVTRIDYSQVDQEMNRVADALHELVEMRHMAVYGLTIMRQLMFAFAMKDMPLETTRCYMKHANLASDSLYESLRTATKDFIGKNRNAGVKIPIRNSYFMYFNNHYGPYHQFVLDSLLKAQPETSRLFLMLRRFSNTHSKLKRLVDWTISIRFARQPAAKNLINMYRLLDPKHNAESVATDLIPGLGGHRSYDSKLTDTLLKTPGSLDLIQHQGMGLKAFVDYQLTGLERNITTQQKGFFGFASVMLECASREPAIDRKYMAEKLIPRFHTAFCDDNAYATLCLRALELLPLSREAGLTLTTYALAANPGATIEPAMLPKDPSECVWCLDELGKLKIGGVRLKAAKKVAVLLALKMDEELNKDPLLKRQALEQDLGI